MKIEWLAFATVLIGSAVAACLVVVLFSLALRLGDGQAAWRRPASVALYVLCALAVIAGIVLIVPPLRALVLPSGG